MIAALIFDVDGTLAETEEVHRAAFNATFADAGLPWTWDEALYARLLDVTGGKERMRHYIAAHGGTPALDDAAIAALHAEKTRRYAAIIASGTVTLRPGIARLLDEARAAGIPVAIATTTTRGNIEALLAATLGPDAIGRFAAIGAGDDVPAKKPAPDVYELVLRTLGADPARCVAVEDTVNGLSAASAAHIPTVLTQSLYGGTEGFAAALTVVDHLGDPGQPCTVMRGHRPAGDHVTLADLSAWLA